MVAVQEEDKHAHIIPKVFPPIPLVHDDYDDDDSDDTKVVKTLDEYKIKHAESIRDIHSFWYKEAIKRLDWFVLPTCGSTDLQNRPPRCCYGDFESGDITWFPNGKLNVSYNAIDRHVMASSSSSLNANNNKIAMIWEGDEPNDIRTITFQQLLQKTCQIANALKSVGVQKGDVVTIYMPMIPELPMTMLACTRIGAIHSVVFAGFSSEALAQRVSDAQSKVIVTADIGKRGGKTIYLKDIVNDCRTKHTVESTLQHVLVYERFYKREPDSSTTSSTTTTGATTYEMKDKDVRMDVLVSKQRPYCVPEFMDAEDPLFILYTSGSTGKPKGLVHTTGGYALFASYTTQTSFGMKGNATKKKCNNNSNNTNSEVFACVADCGWITGHTYVVYGPLLNGCTTFVFESTPVYPTPGRYWEMIVRHRITYFYTAPTAIRLLMKFGDTIPQQYNQQMVSTSLKVLGTVGEPINPEAWRWYYELVGCGKCTIVDTYWQTETGGHVITNLPGITPMKPGSCTLPMYGIDPVVLDPMTGMEIMEPNDDTEQHGKCCSGILALKQPWPGMARTCLNDHERYLQTYMHVYKGGYYYTGDSVVRDSDGYYFIIGRVDDVLNVSGHRIGTAEVESALVAHGSVAQAAVVGQPHDIKGTSIAAFVMLKDEYNTSSSTSTTSEQTLIHELRSLVRMDIGGFATPDVIIVTPSLPMTRSGKIMRRILRKILCNETDTLGDTSTLADPSIVPILIEKVQNVQGKI